MSIEEKARVVMELMNRNAGFGLSKNDFIKKYPAKNVAVVSKNPDKLPTIMSDTNPMRAVAVNSPDNTVSLKGNGDFTTHYGNRKEYPLVPLSIRKIINGGCVVDIGGGDFIPGIEKGEDIVKLSGLDSREYRVLPTTGLSVTSVDGDEVISIPGIDLAPYEKELLKRKGRNGFIRSQDSTLPYVRKGARITEKDIKNGNLVIMKKSQLNKVLGLRRPVLGKFSYSRDEFKQKVKGGTKTTLRKKRAPTEGSKFLSTWRSFMDEMKSQPFMKNVKYVRGGSSYTIQNLISLLYELDNQLKSKGYPVEERRKIVGKLNEKEYGSGINGYISPDDVIKTLSELRKRLNKTTNREIPKFSQKLNEINAKLYKKQ